jgi:hypothetical protein
MVSSQLLENTHGVSASSDCVYSLGISLILWSNFLLSFVRTWESSKKHWDWQSVWIHWIRIPSGGTGLKWKNELWTFPIYQYDEEQWAHWSAEVNIEQTTLTGSFTPSPNANNDQLKGKSDCEFKSCSNHDLVESNDSVKPWLAGWFHC